MDIESMRGGYPAKNNLTKNALAKTNESHSNNSFLDLLKQNDHDSGLYSIFVSASEHSSDDPISNSVIILDIVDQTETQSSIPRGVNGDIENGCSEAAATYDLYLVGHTDFGRQYSYIAACDSIVSDTVTVEHMCKTSDVPMLAYATGTLARKTDITQSLFIVPKNTSCSLPIFVESSKYKLDYDLFSSNRNVGFSVITNAKYSSVELSPFMITPSIIDSTPVSILPEDVRRPYFPSSINFIEDIIPRRITLINRGAEKIVLIRDYFSSPLGFSYLIDRSLFVDVSKVYYNGILV